MKTKLVFICAALTSGGAERVMSILVNRLSQKENLQIHLVLLTKQSIFYKVSDKVILHEPNFSHGSFSRFKFTIKTFFYLRNKLRYIQPDTLLSFGGRYNSFAVLAALGLPIRSYISDRSRPGISYGRILDLLNRITYRLTNGIIAQTHVAADYIFRKTKHKNIQVVGNPVPLINSAKEKRQKIILNVGRFISSKHQDELIHVFAQIQHKINPSWRLIFLGDGECLASCKKLVDSYRLKNKVIFEGSVKDVESYYRKAEIFAFTSHSEGFPNALAEAMSAGCACISYDCNAGPSELIDNGENGILVQQGDLKEFGKKLLLLTENKKLRSTLMKKAKEKVLQFSEEEICDKYFKVLSDLPSSCNF
jgi:glycosyltransferase involved in cell wall biosynthesis